MATEKNTTEVADTDVKSDEDLVVEVIDDIDAVEAKTDEVEVSDEVEEALQEIKDGETTVVESEEELVESLNEKTDDEEVEEKADEETETAEVEEVEEKSEIEETLETLLVEEEEDLKVKHLQAIGLDTEPEEDEFLCSIERKMLKGDVCAHCRGGCMPEGEKKELPGLLDIELKATDEYGVVIASGYDPASDLFLLNVERKDGKVIEVAYDGHGEGLGWQLLNQDLVQNKDALAGQKVVSFDEAAEIAARELEGEAKSVEASIYMLDGDAIDAYVVEVVTPEGKSFDAHIRIDGEVIGYDEFMDEAEVKAGDMDMPKKPAAPAAPDAPAAPNSGKLASQVSAIEDAETLKSVIEAIGEDVDVVPDDVKGALIATAKKLDATEYLPKAWMSAEDSPAEDAAEAAPVEEEASKKSVEVVIDGETPDEDFAATLEEFKSMIEGGE